MPLILRKATAEDVEALIDVYLSAFSENPISLLIFPHNASTRKSWHDRFTNDIKNPNSHVLCIVDTDSSTQTLAAFAKWDSPEAPVNTELPAQWPEGADTDLANYFFGTMLKRHAEIEKGKRHWYLECIGTKPEYRGKGAAGQLIKWGLEKSDAEGTETYLEASPDGKPIYEHFGFKEIDHFVVSIKKGFQGEKESVECFMVRPVTGT